MLTIIHIIVAHYNDIQKREIFHFLFLEQLVRISDPKLYLVKGGVNLRFFFKSPRYSEDMDIDVVAGNVATLKKNGYKILESGPFKRSLQSFGIVSLIVNDPTKAKQTETTQRFRVRLVTEAGDSLPTKVEFSRRNKERVPFEIAKIDPEIARSYHRLAYRCQHYTGEAAVVQKIRALAKREVTQARDVFDLGILHSGGFTNATLIKKELTKDTLQQAKENLNSLEYDEYKGQVIEFLNPSERKQYENKEIWNELKRTVLRTLDNDL